MESFLELIAGLVVLAACAGLLWVASPVAGEPPPFMRRSGMQTLVPVVILFGVCGAGTLLVRSLFTVIG